jgi:flagellar biosynthesis protein FliR
MSYQIADLEHWFLVFCRVGGCLMLMPGFASGRIPMRVRLFLALVVALALAPLISPVARPFQQQAPVAALYVAVEVCTGAALGLMGRAMFAGLQFGAAAAAAMIGLSPQGQAIEDDQPSDALAEMFTLTAAVLFFLLDLHIDVILGLLKTYEFLPLGGGLKIDEGMTLLAVTLNRGFSISLQVVAPFVAYSILINLVFSVINKMVPQFPAYFVSVPFVLAGGLVLAAFVISNGLDVFFTEFTRVLSREMGG